MPQEALTGKAGVFGPVPSRRLGRSLGVDLIPPKTCTFDCTYCQIGRTTCKTEARADLASKDAVLASLKRKLDEGVEADVVTIAGSGEPTLHSQLGEIIDGIKSQTDIPVAIITNGSLLWDPSVRAACAKADIVMPSLDAADQPTFEAINRPHPSLKLDRIVDGLIAFRREFSGQMWLEVFVLDDVNSSDAHVAKLGELVARIQPDKVQLNTAVRPTADAGVRRVPEERMQQIQEMLAAATGLAVEVVADYSRVHEQSRRSATPEDVLDTLKRRPCTADDLAAGMGLDRAVVDELIGVLVARGAVRPEEREAGVYYVAAV